MADEKEIAKLVFNIQDAEKQLDTLNAKFEKFNKDSKKIAEDYAKIQNRIALEDAKAKNKIEVQNNATYNKLVEIDAKREAIVEANMQKEILENSKKNKEIEADEKKTINKLKVIGETRFKNSESLAGKLKVIEEQRTSHTKRQAEIRETNHKKQMDSVDAYSQKMAIKEEYRQKHLAESQKSVWDKMSNMANAYLVTRGLSELRQAAVELVNEMADVEYRMVEIDRVLNESSLNIDIYKDKLISLAYEYGNSFENVSDVTLRLAQAGFDSTEALKLTESTLLALNTAELDATQATEDMVAVMSQWGLMTGDAEKKGQDYAAIIDRINKVADNFPTTSEDILEALKKTSSAFNLAGASIDETIAMIVTAEIASQRGGKEIGTAMNNIIQQMKDTKKMATMESLGIEIYTDATKTEFNSIIDIITQLSEKMQQLKKDGRENTQEMQDLLEVFTLFRRNVGAGLLSGVAGEDSDYAKVLKTSMDSLGYSLQENEKYMKTAKAAQEQFNATLLQLKTAVWDNGAEDVFRALLLLGSNLIEVFTNMIKTFGTVPTVMGMVTLALMTFSKNLKVARIETDAMSESITGVVANSKIASKAVAALNNAYQTGKISAEALTLATGALQAVMSLGLSVAITAVLTGLHKLINAEEEAKRKADERVDQLQEQIGKTKEQASAMQELIDKYEELNAISEKDRTTTENEELKVIQEQIGKQLRLQGVSLNEINGGYDEQLKRLKEITKEKLQQEILDQKAIVREKEAQNKPVKAGFWEGFTDVGGGSLLNAGISIEDVYNRATGKNASDLRKGAEVGVRLSNILDRASLEDQIKFLKELEIELDVAAERGENVANVSEYISGKLDDLTNQEEGLLEAQEALNELLAQESFDKLIDDRVIENSEDYKNLLEEISESEPPEGWTATTEEFRDIIENMAAEKFPELNSQIEISSGNFSSLNSVLNSSLGELDSLAEKYQTLEAAVEEYNTAGQLTSATLQSLVDNNLLQYLDLTADKASINAQEFLNLGEAQKVQAIEALQSAAAIDIEKVAMGDVESISPIAKAAIAQFGDEAVRTGNKAASSVNAIEAMAKALQDAHDGALGKLGKGVSTSTFEKQSNAIIKSYTNYAKQISKLDISSPLYGGKSSGGRSSGGGGGGSAKQATKTFEEESSERVKIFKEEISKLTSLEENWVKKFKQLNLLSTSDLMFIQRQRISKYGDILNQINGLTGITEKDRAALIQEYSKQRQEAELEYFDLLKQKLEEQISNLKKANEERIQSIKDAADAQIDALKKVESENDRIRQKEEYERKRQELIYGNQGIEYWRQRTGRDAQLALQDAEEKLRDLDQDWEDKKKDWTLDDQIEQIEKARDAQVKAIEDAQEKQIEGWQAAYNAQVQLYAQTGQIIYDDSVINAGYLYTAYMDNFVNPLHSQLQNVIASLHAASAVASEVSNKIGGGSGSGGGGSVGGQSTSGGTSKTITVQQVGSALTTAATTIWDKTKQKVSNSVVGNTIKFFKNLPRSHSGNEIGGTTEGLSILRPNEIVLNPEWTKGMKSFLKDYEAGRINAGNVTQVDVQGNLVNMEGVEIKDRKDVDYLKDTVIREVEKKLNVRK